MNFQFSAFADESSNVFAGQIDALKRNSYNFLEIRNVDGKNVTQLTVSEAKQLSGMLADQGLSVWSVGSPIGKIPINGDFDSHLELYRHTLELANVFGAKQIRLFSFYMPVNTDPEQFRSVVLDRMGILGQLAVRADVIACHENEKGIYGDTPCRCAQIHEACPQIKAVFDPANFVQCAQDTLQAWQALAPYVQYLHIKDALPTGLVTPAGKGSGNIAAIIRDYASRGGRVLSLEPHLYEFAGLKGLEQSGGESIVGHLHFSTAEAAFDYAVHALNQLLEGLQ